MIEALQKPEIQIFLITVVSYLMGFLIYGGYLSAFAGSTGNIPFALADLTLIDLIAILPIAIITALSKAFQAIHRVVLFLVVYGLIPTAISIVVYVFVGPKIFPPLAATVRLLAIALWIGVEFFATWKNIRYRSWRFVFCVFILIIAAFLYGISAPTSAELQTSASTIPGSQIINSILTVVIVIFGLLSMYAVGILTAEVAVEREALSKVARLVLQQPIPTLGVSTPVIIEPANEKKLQQKGLFKPIVSPPKTPEVFVFEPPQDHPVYLVSSFRNFTLFYLPRDPAKKVMDGKVVTVLNGLIYSIELVIQRRTVS